MKTVKTSIRVGKKGAPDYKEIPIEFTAPESDVEFQKYIASLSGPALTKARNDHYRGLDLSVRAAHRPAAPGGEPVYTMFNKQKGVTVDLRQLPVPTLVTAINGVWAGMELSGKSPNRALIHTRAWLLAEGKATEKDGVLVVKK